MIQIRLNAGLVAAVLLVMFNVSIASNPVVVATNPPQNGLNASKTTSIEVEFDVDIDEATINNSSFTVNALYSGCHTGTFVYDDPGRTVTFTSNRDFQISEVVTVTLTAGIQSLGGEPLSQSYTWSFTVEVIQGYGGYENAATYEISIIGWPMASGDFDNDGDIDIAASQGLDGLMVLLNSGDATFIKDAVIFPENVGSVHTAADFDGDGYLDLSTDAAGIVLNMGDGSFEVDSVYGLPQEAIFGSCAGDFNGDGANDLVITLASLDVVSVMLNLGDGTFAPAVEYAVDEHPQSVTAADFDGDGDLDLAVLNRESRSVTVLFNNGDGLFPETPGTYSNIGEVPWAVTTADIDSDGENDIITSNYMTPTWGGAISMLINDGNGTFSEIPYFCDTRDGLTQLRAVDFDADGRLDIAAGNITVTKPDDPSVFLLWNYGTGEFLNYSTHTVIGGMSWAYLFADLDGDGDIDAAWNDFISGAILIHLSQEHLVTCGDANSDGDANIGDAVHLISYIFKDGPAPDPLCEGDANGDGYTNVADVVYLVNYVFNEGTPPVEDCCL